MSKPMVADYTDVPTDDLEGVNTAAMSTEERINAFIERFAPHKHKTFKDAMFNAISVMMIEEIEAAMHAEKERWILNGY